MFLRVVTCLTLLFFLGPWALAQQGFGISAGLNSSRIHIKQSETPNTFYEGYHSIVNLNFS